MARWLVLAPALLTLAGCASAAPRPPDAEIKAILDQRATHTMDEARLRALVAQDAVVIDEKGTLSVGPDDLVPSFAPMPPVLQLREEIDDVRLRPAGDLVVATYRRQAHLVLGGGPVAKSWRVTETFARGPQGWQSVSFHETVILGLPVPHGGDPGRLDEYVGRYELQPGVVYRVVRDGDRLLFGNKLIRDIVPESTDAFVVGGDPDKEGFGYRVVFVREGGAVTRLRLVEFPGVEYEARRLTDAPPPR